MRHRIVVPVDIDMVVEPNPPYRHSAYS
jgi:hypothetical protein